MSEQFSASNKKDNKSLCFTTWSYIDALGVWIYSKVLKTALWSGTPLLMGAGGI